MTLVKEIKGHSSFWFKRLDRSLTDFYWQDGYGAFSVSPTDLEKISKYIENQKEHHKQLSFQEEYRMILKKYKVEDDERYVWD